ncbi:MAG TPA: RCCLKC-tail radical SAM protein [Micromonosporaceae bacterium]
MVSAFEAEMQPVAASWAAAALGEQGLEVSGWDAHMFPDRAPTDRFDLVLVSVQQFEGLERGLELARKFRSEDRAGTVIAFGQYARLNASAFLGATDGVLMVEPEFAGSALADCVAGRSQIRAVPGLLTRQGMTPPPPRRRISVRAPARSLFPSLAHYPAHHTSFGLMGNIEVSRGCHHKCTYCSVYGAYGGGVAAYEADVVVADAKDLAEQGVRHFMFIDAEFFNSRRLGVQVAEQIAREIPGVTFEMTTRIDHILDYTDELTRLVSLGLRRVTSALEFPSDRVLRIFDKGIDVADMRQAIAEAARLGFELNPTFIPFTPWVSLEELLGFEDFLVDTGLAARVDPTVLQTRLLLFKGSPLLVSPWVEDIDTVDRGFWLDWAHPDRRVDQLWEQRRAEAQKVGKTRCCVKC